ncbi:MAG: PspA/IM30 family protein [Spirochaetales bacterium]|nr:PspA/IM30 family protein [Spirochaetales bacterium]
MGIWDNLKRVFKSNINAAISKAEDPQKILEQTIIDMNEQLIENKKAVASAIADEKRLERQYLENQASAQDWESKAVLAVKSNRDDLAKEALLRQKDYENLAAQFKQQFDAQHEAVEKLKDSLRQLQSKIEEASRKKNILIARAKRAEAQKKISETMSSMSNNSAFEAFDRMANKVDQMEAEASAATELEDLSGEGDLEKQFKDLEKGDTKADLLLEDLKAKMKTQDVTVAQTVQQKTN